MLLSQSKMCYDTISVDGDNVMAQITADVARSLLNYDKNTGEFTWRISRKSAKRGDKAGSLNTIGYLTIRVNYKLYYGHRLAWLIVKGVWPARLDHKNLDKSDNRFSNLRLASHRENHGNTPKYKNNTSGIKGVSRNNQKNAWDAYITIYGRKKHLGRFDKKEDASLAYQKAAKEHFGEFARFD